MSTRHISSGETLWEPRISFIFISSDTSVDSWIYGGLKRLGVLVFASIETGPSSNPIQYMRVWSLLAHGGGATLLLVKYGN